MIDPNPQSKERYNVKGLPGVASGVVKLFLHECQLLPTDNTIITKGAAPNRPGAMVSCPLHAEEY